MTATEFDRLTAPPRPEPKRDRWGRYLIPHPVTGKEQGWTRATTFAKSIADTFALTKWELRMTAVGLARRPDLIAHAATVADPDHPDGKRTLDEIAAAAKEAAGASTRARLGIALHAMCEAADLTGEVTAPDPYRADVAAYVETMRAAGITVDRAHVERIVVVPDLGVAGTFDRLVTLPDGRLVVADVKTGRDLAYAWTEIAIQLALYAHASHLYDPATGVLEAMPEVDRTEALVMHLPVGDGRCDLYAVDIAAGWDAVRLCGEVRDWRKRKDLAHPFAGAPAGAGPAAQETPPAPDTSPAPVADPAPLAPAVAAVVAEAHRARREHLRSCVAQVRDFGMIDALSGLWPADLPGFAGDPAHTPDELDRIERVLRQLEADYALDFTFFPEAENPAEATVPADDPRVADLAARFSALPSDLRADVLDEMKRHDVPRLSTGRATTMQVAQVAGWLAAVEQRHDMRVDEVERLAGRLAAAGVDPDPWLETAGGTVDSARFTGAALTHLAALLSAWDAGWIAVDLNPGAALRAMLKAEVLAAGRAAAKHLGAEVAPRSADEVLASPLLVAYAALHHGAHGVPS